MVSARVLIVEDDAELRAVLARGLAEESFDVSMAANGAEAMRALGRDQPDALIVDIGLPDADGRDICQALRARGVQAPVLFLTARDAVADRLAGFSAGGDDYVTKPFAFAEVIARLTALLRRSGIDGTTAVGDLSLDPVGHAATWRGETIDVTPTEFRLLAALAARTGETVTRRELVRSAWPDGAIVHDNTLDVYIARLRRILGVLAGAPAIATAHGVGYRIE